MENSEYEIFKAIVDFVVDLDSVYGSKYKSISLYKRLVSKMSIANTDPIRKHIAVFSGFCADNKSSLESGDLSNLSQPLLKYSDRVFVQLDTVLQKSDAETNKTILKHLLTINALINSSDKSAVALLSNASHTSTDDILSDLINTVTQSIDPSSGADPLSAAMGLISSGKLSNIISTMTSGVTNGTINTEAMLKKVTSMYMNVTKDDKDAPDINSIISTVTKSIS